MTEQQLKQFIKERRRIYILEKRWIKYLLK